MGEAKRRSKEIEALKGRNTVRHVTKHQWFCTIVDQNRLELEGSNTNALPPIPEYRKMLEEQHRLVGRYVWFTTQRTARCAGANASLYFEFDQDEMRFEKWSDICLQLSDKGKKLANILNFTARCQGDDPDQWYVSRTPVSLDRCINSHMFSQMRRQAEMIDRAFQQHMRQLEAQAHAANDGEYIGVA